MGYTLEALGNVIRDRRESLKLTQGDLGKAAGYGSGAGVSISRIERGLSRPSDQRLDAIALSLECTREHLEGLAERGTKDPRKIRASGGGEPSLRERLRRVQKEIDERACAIDEAAAAFNEAHDRARDNFLMKFVEVARAIEGAPELAQPDSPQVPPAGDRDPSEEAEAQRLRLGKGLAATLAGGAGGAAAGAAAGGLGAYGTLTAALTFGTASTGVAISGLSGAAASSAAYAWLGGGSLAAGGAGVAGGTALLTGIVATPALLLAAGGAFIVARRSAKQRRELTEKLVQVEKGLKANEKGYLALLEFLPWAAQILDYIAIHAAHALDRWQNELPPEPVRWEMVRPAQQATYQDFITIAATQLSVITINVHALLAERDKDNPDEMKEFDELKAFDSALLEQAEEVVKRLV